MLNGAVRKLEPSASNVVIRELASFDRAAVAFTFDRLGDRSRYQRFLGPKRTLSERELDRFVTVDHWHHEALIAWSALPRAPVGIARYVRLSDFDTAELAIEVVEDWQRHGIGRALVSALSERAVRAGIRRFTGTMLRDNEGARSLARALGPLQLGAVDHDVVELLISVG